MRMWNVDPSLLCQKHLCGEHYEMHSFLGSYRKGRKLDGYIKNGSLDLGNIKDRHDDLVFEMLKRGYKHYTPIEDIGIEKTNNININKNIKSLFYKCSECKKRITSELGELSDE